MTERLFRLLGLLMLLGSLAFGWLWLGYQNFADAPLQVAPEGASFEVRPGASLTGIASALEQAGHIDNRYYFIALARLSGQARAVRAGEYRIEHEMSARALLDRMVEGAVQLHALTLVEGWNFRQLREAVQASPYLRHTLNELEDAELMARLGYADVHPEGRFFPDTYHFPRGLSDVDFLRRAYRQMQDVLNAEWSQRSEKLPLKSADEALILASIIEKETGQANERTAIAGVFVRRLNRGMRLQTDPTVIYGRGLNVEGRLRRKDLLTDTPYNTYTRGGLPPTPIAMPGRESIHAALHPADGKALYFVSKGDGSHQFSATLEEHNRAVRIYQLGLTR